MNNFCLNNNNWNNMHNNLFIKIGRHFYFVFCVSFRLCTIQKICFFLLCVGKYFGLHHVRTSGSIVNCSFFALKGVYMKKKLNGRTTWRLKKSLNNNHKPPTFDRRQNTAKYIYFIFKALFIFIYLKIGHFLLNTINMQFSGLSVYSG